MNVDSKLEVGIIMLPFGFEPPVVLFSSSLRLRFASCHGSLEVYGDSCDAKALCL